MTKEIEEDDIIGLIADARKRASELASQSDSVRSELGPGHSDSSWEDSCLIARLTEALRTLAAAYRDERSWNAKRKDQYDRIGRALDPFRSRRSTGEPSRSDAEEVEALAAAYRAKCEEIKRLQKIAFEQAQAADTLDEVTDRDGQPNEDESFESLATAVANARSFLTTHNELEVQAALAARTQEHADGK